MHLVSFANRLAIKINYMLLLTFKHYIQRLSNIRHPNFPVLHALVAGVQRSGTNMLMDVLERSFETDVYHERDRRAFQDYLMREASAIKRLAGKSSGRVFVIKALCELDQLPFLMEEFTPAKVLWIVRGYNDMINSALKSFKSLPGSVARIIRDRDGSDWQARGMSENTYELLQEFYHNDINEASAVALFWYLRNILFFEHAFDRDPRVQLLFYESLVTDPGREFERIFGFLELDYSRRISKSVFNTSIKRNPAPIIEPRIERLCESLLQRFHTCLEEKHSHI